MKKLIAFSLIILSGFFLYGCATTTYGKTFEPVDEAGKFSIKIYTGGLAFKSAATERLNKEAEKFKEDHGFKSYEVISSHYVLLPASGTEFVVKFNKN